MALTLTLSALIAVTGPLLALFAASAFEPLIARNLVDTTRALYVAETGIEWAIGLIVAAAAGQDPPRAVAADAAGSEPPGESPGGLVLPAGLLPWGTAAVTARNSAGAPVEVTSLGAHDVIILTSTGMVNGAQRTIEATVRRTPPGPGGGQHRLVGWRER